MALAYDAGGWGGVVALCAAAFGVTSAVLLRLLLQDIRPLPALLFTAAAFTMMACHFLARPFALAFPFMLWWVAGLVRAVEERRAPEPLLLVAMLVWANLHGGFTLGLMLAGAFAIEALIGGRDLVERKMIFLAWLKFGVAALLVSCTTPYGFGSILVTFQILGMGDALALITEWKSPDFQTQPLMEAILLIALYLVLARGVKLPLIRVLIVVGLMHMFLRHVRNAELLATLAPLAIAPVLARQWPAVRRDPEGKGLFGTFAGPAGRNMLALGLVLGVVYIVGLVRFAGIRPPEDTAPTAALQFAREAGLTKGHVLNHYGYGGYSDQRRHPDLHRRPRRALRRRVHQEIRRGDPSHGRRAQPAREHARALGHSLDPAAQGAAGQQIAGAPAGLASSLCRRQGDDLRARALGRYALVTRASPSRTITVPPTAFQTSRSEPSPSRTTPISTVTRTLSRGPAQASNRDAKAQQRVADQSRSKAIGQARYERVTQADP